MADKVLLEFKKNVGYDYIFEEVGTDTEVTLKIYKDKEFKDNIKPGDQGFALVNSNWINTWEPLEPKEPEKTITQTIQSKPTQTVTENKTLGLIQEEKKENILAQSTFKEAVQLYMHTNKDLEFVDYDELFEIHKGLFRYMSEKGYKK